MSPPSSRTFGCLCFWTTKCTYRIASLSTVSDCSYCFIYHYDRLSILLLCFIYAYTYRLTVRTACAFIIYLLCKPHKRVNRTRELPSLWLSVSNPQTTTTISTSSNKTRGFEFVRVFCWHLGNRWEVSVCVNWDIFMLLRCNGSLKGIHSEILLKLP